MIERYRVVVRENGTDTLVKCLPFIDRRLAEKAQDNINRELDIEWYYSDVERYQLATIVPFKARGINES